MIYAVDVYYNEGWWMLHVPELDDGDIQALTQAKKLKDAEQEVKDFIFTLTDLPFSQVDVQLNILGIDANHIKNLRNKKSKIEDELKKEVQTATHKLKKLNVPNKDIAYLCGVSRQYMTSLTREEIATS